MIKEFGLAVLIWGLASLVIILLFSMDITEQEGVEELPEINYISPDEGDVNYPEE